MRQPCAYLNLSYAAKNVNTKTHFRSTYYDANDDGFQKIYELYSNKNKIKKRIAYTNKRPDPREWEKIMFITLAHGL
jgi:hypothetical protein